MAFEFVNPASAIWAFMGVSHILMNPGALAHTKPASRDAALAAAFARQAGNTKPHSKEYAAPCNAHSSSSGNAARSWNSKEASTAREPAAPKNVAKPPVFTPVPFEQWPDIWQQQFQKTKKGLFGWTYWNLGEDLLASRQNAPENGEAARARKTRSQVMGRLLRELGHPPGTHTFWPPYLETTGNAQPEMFWSGLKFLGCRGVIIFGSQAARALIQKPGLRPLQQFSANGFRVWIMKDLSGIEQDPAHYASMLVLLKETLKVFIRK